MPISSLNNNSDFNTSNFTTDTNNTTAVNSAAYDPKLTISLPTQTSASPLNSDSIQARTSEINLGSDFRAFQLQQSLLNSPNLFTTNSSPSSGASQGTPGRPNTGGG